jgi:hypothetical protein
MTTDREMFCEIILIKKKIVILIVIIIDLYKPSQTVSNLRAI